MIEHNITTVSPTGNAPSAPVDRLLRLPEVLKIVPLKKTAWYDGVAGGRFPRPVSLGGRAVAWRERDIAALVEQFGRTQ